MNQLSLSLEKNNENSGLFKAIYFIKIFQQFKYSYSR